MNKKRLNEIINKASIKDIPSTLYDLMIIICVVLGLVPLLVKQIPLWYKNIEILVGIIYVMDLLLRIWTWEIDKNKKKWLIVADILSIIASFNISKWFKITRIIQLFKLVRYSESLQNLVNVIQKCWKALISVMVVACAYIILSAIILFNVEPDKFNTIFEAIYYSTILMTSVGLGDIICTTMIGRFITMLSSIMGIAIVSLPTAVLTANYMIEINTKNKKYKQ